MIRPLRRTGEAGVWRTRDERYTILRHWSDPIPPRWYVYENDGSTEQNWPINDGLGHTRLADCADWLEDIEKETS